MNARQKFLDSLRDRRGFLRFTTITMGSLGGGICLVVFLASEQVPPRFIAFTIVWVMFCAYLAGYLFGVVYWKYVMVPVYGFGDAESTNRAKARP